MKRISSWLRGERLFIAAMMLLAFVEVSVISQIRLWSMVEEVFDLARMAQAIWSAAKGEWLVFTNAGHNYSRLLDHAEVIYLAFTPLLRLSTYPGLLLMLQAAFLALGVIPVYRIGKRHGGIGKWLVWLYIFYPTVQTAFLCGFHADTFAAVFLLWAIDDRERERWPAFWGWIVLALWSKIYVAVAVVMLAGKLFLEGERRRGIWLAAGAVLWSLIAFLGFKTLLAPLYHVTPVKHAEAYLLFRYDFRHLAVILATWGERLITFVVVAAPVLLWLPFGGLWGGMWAVLVSAALLSTVPTHSFYFHHYALATPFLVLMLAEGYERTENRPRWRSFARAWANLWVAVLFGLAVIGSCCFFHTRLSWQAVQRGQAVVSWLQARVDPQAPLLASFEVAPFFATRPWILPTGSFTPETVQPAQEAAIDLLGTTTGDFLNDREALLWLLNNPAWHLTDRYDGVYFFRRGAGESLATRGTVMGSANANLCAGGQQVNQPVGNGLTLVCAEFQPNAAHTALEARFVWAWQPTTPQEGLLITAAGGSAPAGERWVHLPLLQHPPEAWQAGRFMVEQMTWPVYIAPGCYPLETRWYRLNPRANIAPTLLPGGEAVPTGALVVEEGQIVWQEGCGE